jgi:hypothetical protein
MLRWLLKLGLMILALGLFLFGLIALGDMAWRQIHQGDRYLVAFTDIDCVPPDGRARTDFLDEVQYLAGMSARLNLLDKDLTRRLAEAFTHHPWVERVTRVELVPPQTVKVELVYRTPVLAISQGGHIRVVDGQGILLPRDASARGLPVFSGVVTPPRQPEGNPWGDRNVEAAARTAAFLRPYQQRLHLVRVELSGGGLAWMTPGGSRVLWGRPAGEKDAREAASEEKRDRLLRYCDAHGNLEQPEGRQEHDVRPVAQAIIRPLRPAMKR